MSSNLTDLPAKADQDSLNMAAYADALTMFVADAEAPLTIGRKVVFGPRPTIITGDHRIDIIGKHIIDVTVEEKLPENDQPVVIEDGYG